LIQKLLLLACAGACGTLARYGLAGLIHRINEASFPWGTLVVNAAGCFLAGLVWTLFERRWPMAGEMRVLVFVGFMGAFTTFSSFILETNELMRSAAWMYAAANIFMQNGFGFLALLAGVSLGRLA